MEAKSYEIFNCLETSEELKHESIVHPSIDVHILLQTTSSNRLD